MIMKFMYEAIAFYIVCSITTCNGKSYKDYSLVHATPKNKTQLEFFKKLENVYNATFWRQPGLVHKPVEFSISRYAFADLIRDTRDMNIEFFTIIRDLQSAFEQQTVKQYIRRNMDSFNWQNYYSVDDIYNWLKDLSEMHPREVKLETIGQSVQSRNLLAVKVSLAPDSRNRRFKIMIEGGCHAREWISPAFVTYMINTILNAKNTTNKELKRIAYAYDWIFIPLFNPDGYAHSQTVDRMWRKNVHGVDLNRNFGISFGKHGASKDKESQDYCGPNAFSEPETAALASFASVNSQDLLYYLALHSYGQYIIIPYAFEEQHLENYKAVKYMGDKASRRSTQNFRISYYVGTAFDTVGYFASGISSDWIKKSLNVKYAIAIELPDQGQTGFALPPQRIQPTCEATMDMLLDFFDPQNDVIVAHLADGNGVRLSPEFIIILFCNVIIYILQRLHRVY